MKRKRELMSGSAALTPGLLDRAIVINVSAALRKFYTALAEIESQKRGTVVTAEELVREMRGDGGTHD